jgi:hypothetical protein
MYPEIGNTLNMIGNMQMQPGSAKGARVSLQRALEIEEAVYGPVHSEVASTLSKLGAWEPPGEDPTE